MKSFRNLFSATVFFAAPLLVIGCTDEKLEPATPPPTAEVANYALASDPGEALGVAAAKTNGPQDRVVVEGRVHDVTKGFAVLKLMDASLDYCGQIDAADKCPTPWDYCCDTPDDIRANSLLVEIRDAAGKPLATPSLPNTRLCDLVKVTGKLEQDEHQNLVLVADGLYRVERPTLPGYVKWPQ